MAVDFRFKFPLPNGLHARPASHFQALTRRFRSKVELIHERTCYKANVRSVLSMVSADIKCEDPCRVQISGDDEQPAMEAVRSFLKNVLPHCDEVLPDPPPIASHIDLPRSLQVAGLKSYLSGTAMNGGVGCGQVVFIDSLALPHGIEEELPGDPADEEKKVQSAIAQVAADISSKVATAQTPQEAQVLLAHAAIVEDVALAEFIADSIVTKHRTGAQAIIDACRTFADALRKAESAYLRERVMDIEDVCVQLLERIVGKREQIRPTPTLRAPSICVAHQLTPAQLLALDREQLKGLVLGESGTTSHTVILARSMNIPTLVGVPRAMTTLRPGQEVIVDGELGLVVSDLSEMVRRYYRTETETLDRRRRRLETVRDRPGATSDGHSIEVAANVISAEEVGVAMKAGADGVGLFRTEMLFMNGAAPSEEQQTEAYSAAAQSAGGRPVIIRLVDIGGDKPAAYLNLQSEENPFLGYRGVRLYGEFSQLVRTQLRAILRASLTGDVRILIPMVCCIEELQQVRRMLIEAAAELTDSGIDINHLPPLGVMIEVPSLAFLMPELCREADFFSIGSNDLMQYFLAADRTNQNVSALYTWSHPAFLRLLKSVVDQAHAAGKWIGLCGEMSDNTALPLLIGLGLDEISVSAPRIAEVKAAIGAATFSECRKILERVLKAETREAVNAVLRESSAQSTSGTDASLLSADLVFHSDGITKEEVVRELTNTLYLADRVTTRQPLENAIWKREDTYSTGFGHGFAIPHCKCDCLRANSIVIAKLSSPVEWGAMDGKPVDVVILLAIRPQDHAEHHMRIFARLSRLVMREEFRQQIRLERDPATLIALIAQDLQQERAAVETSN